MTTVRLPLEIEQKLEILSHNTHKSKTDIIKEALENLFLTSENEKDSYELGIEYFGKYGSGEGNLSKEYKHILKDKLNVKYHSN
jgi:Predicted DNA-binding protein with an HTH domain